MINWVRLLLTVALIGILAGCGQKGPLYMPDDASEEATSTEESS